MLEPRLWRSAVALLLLATPGLRAGVLFGVGGVVAREVGVREVASGIEGSIDAHLNPAPLAPDPGAPAAGGGTPAASDDTPEIEEAAAPDPGAARPGPALQPPRPFVIGRDNLAFANPTGAISIQGMGGNCYTMAVTAKLFYEAANFGSSQPGIGGGRQPGFRAGDIAASLRSPTYPNPKFPVAGATSLYDLSRPPEGVDSERWMEGWARHLGGLDPEPPAGPRPANTQVAAQLYQLITTIHYLHYVQFQADSLIRSAMKRSMKGATATADVTKATVAEVQAKLRQGRLPVLCLFNPAPEVFYGHAVLVYKVVDWTGGEGGGFTDLYIYDSNAQYLNSRSNPETDLDESIVRVHADGTYELMSRKHRTGQIVENGMYDGSSWYSEEDNAVLLVFDDLEADAALRRALAAKLAVSGEAAAYVLAAGDLLRRVTREGPQDSTLFENVRDFLVAVERAGTKLGARPGWRTEDLPPTADVATLNRHLQAYSAKTVATLYPHALPDGISLSEPSLQFDARNGNRAILEATLVLARSRTVDKLLEGIQESALFAGQGDLENLVKGLSRAFEGEEVRVRVRLALEKGRTPAHLRAKVGPYMPVPELLASHVVIGSLRASRAPLTDRRHRIEVSEAVVKKFVDWVLEEEDVEKRYPVNYSIPVLGARTGRLDVNDVWASTSGADKWSSEGWLGLSVDYDGWVGVVSNSKGAGLENGKATFWVTMKTTSKKNVVRVRGILSGSHKVELGFWDWIDNALSSAIGGFFEDVFERLDDSLDDLIEHELSKYVELEGAGPGLGNLTANGKKIYLEMGGFDVDVEKSLQRVLGLDDEELGDLPVKLRDIQFEDDRAVLEIEQVK